MLSYKKILFIFKLFLCTGKTSRKKYLLCHIDRFWDKWSIYTVKFCVLIIFGKVDPPNWNRSTAKLLWRNRTSKSNIFFIENVQCHFNDDTSLCHLLFIYTGQYNFRSARWPCVIKRGVIINHISGIAVDILRAQRAVHYKVEQHDIILCGY